MKSPEVEFNELKYMSIQMLLWSGRLCHEIVYLPAGHLWLTVGDSRSVAQIISIYRNFTTLN